MLKIVINVSTYNKSVILNLRKPQSIKYFHMKIIAESNLLSWFGNILFGSRIKNDLCFWSVYCEPIQYFLKHGGSALCTHATAPEYFGKVDYFINMELPNFILYPFMHVPA